MTLLNKALLGAAALSLFATGAQAAGTITNGSYTVGIGENGELFDYGAYTGFRRDADGFDPLSPGTPRDSWGLSTNFGSAYADQSYYGSAGITGTTITGLGGSSASAVTTTNSGITLSQNFSFVADNILKISETFTNVWGSDVSVLFQRAWDTDPQPTFNNNTFGPVGSSPYVVDSTFYGFESPIASDPYGSSCAAGCNQDSDLGGGIKISIGTLGAGQSFTINYYYGLSAVGQDVDGLIAQAQGLGVNYLIAGQTDENGSYPALGQNGMFIGVGTGSVPEPASWALMLAGFGLTGAALRRQRVRAVFA